MSNSKNKIILQPDRRRQWQRLQSGAEAAGWAESQWAESQWTEPVSKASRESDLLVPIGQAVTSGAFAFVAVLLAVRLAGINYDIPGTFWDRLAAAGLFGVLVAWIRWRGLLEDTRSLLRRAETWINRDLDGDDQIGEPTGETVRLETINDNGAAGHYANLPISRDRLETFARAVAGGRGLAVSTWTGSAGMFSRSEFDQLMSYLERAGIVRWTNAQAHGQGRELTRPGRVAMEQLGKH